MKMRILKSWNHHPTIQIPILTFVFAKSHSDIVLGANCNNRASFVDSNGIYPGIGLIDCVDFAIANQSVGKCLGNEQDKEEG